RTREASAFGSFTVDIQWRWPESWRKYSGRPGATSAKLLDDKHLAETGDGEELFDVTAHVGERKALALLDQAALDAEQDSQAGAGDVIHVGKVELARCLHRFEHLAQPLGLGDIQPSDQKYFPVGALPSVEHACPFASSE